MISLYSMVLSLDERMWFAESMSVLRNANACLVKIAQSSSGIFLGSYKPGTV